MAIISTVKRRKMPFNTDYDRTTYRCDGPNKKGRQLGRDLRSEGRGFFYQNAQNKSKHFGSIF